MRLIDADDLKKKVDIRGRCLRPLVTGFQMCVTVHDIDNAPTIDQYGTWIPCSQRLPGKYELCLITQKVGTQKVRKVALRLLGEWKFNGRKIKDEAVIAWMPLPLPYREEKKDE